MKSLTFQTLRSRFEKGCDLEDRAEDLNTLLGAVSSLLGDDITNAFGTFIKGLAQKHETIKFCGAVLQALLDRKPKDYSDRIEKMQEAYSVLCFTAFFDELDRALPDGIRKSLQLSLKEKKNLFRQSGGRENIPIQMDIVLPDMMAETGAADAFLKSTYHAMAGGLRRFADGLAFRDGAGEQDIRAFEEVLKKLPEAAIRRFHSQYLNLCAQYNEFYIFIQEERRDRRERKWDARYESILAAAARPQESIEAGLASLQELILDLPDRIRQQKVREITERMIRKYRRDIECPLIGTQEEEETGDDLRYPLISEGFIPQAFKLLQYTGGERLELPNTWEPLAAQEDMTAFWARYCLEPGSTERLLLILGEPGGGKSLLTKVLCARMSAPSSMFIRIPLRDCDMEEEIESIIRRQINHDSDVPEPVPTFEWFAEGAPDAPVTLIFDGYDEVLQATGGVYRNLLKQIHQFQNHCRELRHPVRVIITSRETLIDKADIPRGSVVMKLLEFDGPRKDRWIQIWNAHNHAVLSEAGIDDFSLPENNRDIDGLSSQPLLLLMLAMYDADFENRANALKPREGKAETLDRTKLYDRLLRRFIRRELRKGRRGSEIPFDEQDAREQNAMVDAEMRKLGIAALGMFVREKLSLKVGELERDLEYMEAAFPAYDVRNRKRLKSAEIFFGSFFFIHDPRRNSGSDEKEAAFEFLHKTFYEFLAADLILQYLLEAELDLIDLRSSRRNGEQNYQRGLEGRKQFSKAYYSALSGACLCMEPEIIQMAGEWQERKLCAYFANELSPQEAGQVIEDIFRTHMELIRCGEFQPDAWTKDGAFGEHSHPQACAIYLLNLLILRVLFQRRCRVSVKDWNFFSQFVRLNVPPPKEKDEAGDAPAHRESILPSEEIILKFMAQFQLWREGGDILIEKRAQAQEVEKQSLLEARINIFDFAQDDAACAICGLHGASTSFAEKREYQKKLCRQGFQDFEFESYISKLQQTLLTSGSSLSGDSVIREGNAYLARHPIEPSLVLQWFLCLRQYFLRYGAPRLAVRREYEPHKWHDRELEDRYSLGMLMRLVFTRYINHHVIVQAFLAILKDMGKPDMLIRDLELLDRAFLELIDHPEMFSEVLTAVAGVMATGPFMRTQEYIMHLVDMQSSRFSLYSIGSPKVAAALLKVCALIQAPPYKSDISKMSREIIRSSLRNCQHYPPEDLPELLRAGLQTGSFQEVKDFFGELDNNWIKELLALYPDAVDPLFDIAQAVGMDRIFERRIISNAGGRSRLPLRCPGTFMKVVLRAIWDEHNPEHKNAGAWIHIFLRAYEDLFFFNVDTAVQILYLVFEQKVFNRELADPYIHSLRNYQILLERSVRAAAQVLTLFEKMNFEDRELIQQRMEGTFDPVFAIESCFDRALALRDRSCVHQLTELLGSMGDGEKNRLYEYFAGRMPYLRSYSTQLARKIDGLYQ